MSSESNLLLGMAFYVSAFFVTLTCITYTFIQKRTDKIQKKLYLSMLFILLANCVTEFLFFIAVPRSQFSDFYFFIQIACKYLYFLLHTALLPLLGYYVLSVTGKVHSFGRIRAFFFFTPFALIEGLMLSNPIHNQCYTFSELRVYQRGWGVTALYAVSAVYILFFIVNLFRSWKALTSKRRMALVYFLIIVIAGIAIQMLHVELRVELFADSLAFLGLLLTIEDERDLINGDLAIYNRKALRIDLENLLAIDEEFHIICVKIDNADIIRRVTGSSDSGILSKLMQKELTKYVSRYQIYQTAPDSFVLVLVEEDDVEANGLAIRLTDRFSKSFYCQNTEVMLNACIMLAAVPNDVNDVDDIFNMADCTLPINHKEMLIGKNDLSYLLRRREVENAIQRGLDNGNFEVYYQPTFRAKDFSVYGAEALVRLHDDKIENLYPDEFIPIAEQIGLIGSIDDFVLKRVCSFIASGIPDILGIDSINVNISVLQCVNTGFVDHVIDIVKSSGIDHSHINFEITESVNPNDYEKVKSVVRQLNEKGFSVYMDDYGTGYSNMHGLFSMPFDVVKIDKSILWGAEKSDFGMVFLENNTRMLKQMQFGILVEGVETEEQAKLLQSLDVDYLQGFWFSRPIPEKEFVRFLEECDSAEK